MGNKNKYKRPTVKLVFDADERKEFLSGFRKRKAKRKKISKEKMEQEIRDETIRLKNQQKEKMDKFRLADQPLPEIKHLLDISENDLDEDTPDETRDTTKIVTTSDGLKVDSIKGLKKALGKERLTELKKSKAFKNKQNFNRSKNIQKSNSRKRSNKKIMKKFAKKHPNHQTKHNQQRH